MDEESRHLETSYDYHTQSNAPWLQEGILEIEWTFPEDERPRWIKSDGIISSKVASAKHGQINSNANARDGANSASIPTTNHYPNITPETGGQQTSSSNLYSFA